MTDGTGEYAHINNHGADGLFFLAKSWAGVPQTRHVTIPAGTAIYIPVNGISVGRSPAGWASLSGDTNQEKVDHLMELLLPQLYGSVLVPVFYGFEWSLIVPPLRPGQHVIRMQGSFGASTSDVTYHLTVLPK